jgi:micrococcal nuclease
MPRVLNVRKSSMKLSVAIAAVAFLFVSVLQAQDSAIQPKDIATVVHVVDGDTITITYGDKKETVKLIGIEAPENKLSRKAKEEAIKSGQNLLTVISTGIDAGMFVRSLVKKGDVVTLEFDLQNRDIDGRLLAYVYLPDGRMLNEEIVRAGYANVDSYSPNMKYRERFLKAYAEAKEHKRGR